LVLSKSAVFPGGSDAQLASTPTNSMAITSDLTIDFMALSPWQICGIYRIYFADVMT
jgi:hypothetical protein